MWPTRLELSKLIYGLTKVDFCLDGSLLWGVENGCMLRPKVKMVEEEIPKAHHQPPTNKIRLSINLWKRLRNAYVQRMLGLAEHVAHLNNGEICFLKKIHDDEVQLLLAS